MILLLYRIYHKWSTLIQDGWRWVLIVEWTRTTGEDSARVSQTTSPLPARSCWCSNRSLPTRSVVIVITACLDRERFLVSMYSTPMRNVIAKRDGSVYQWACLCFSKCYWRCDKTGWRKSGMNAIVFLRSQIICRRIFRNSKHFP